MRRILAAAAAVVALRVAGAVLAGSDREPEVTYRYSEIVTLKMVRVGPAELLIVLLVIAVVGGVVLAAVRLSRRRRRRS